MVSAAHFRLRRIGIAGVRERGRRGRRRLGAGQMRVAGDAGGGTRDHRDGKNGLSWSRQAATINPRRLPA